MAVLKYLLFCKCVFSIVSKSTVEACGTDKNLVPLLNDASRTLQSLDADQKHIGPMAIFAIAEQQNSTEMTILLHEISHLLDLVQTFDRQIQEYANYVELESSTLEDFARWCVSHSFESLPNVMERLHSLVVPPEEDSLHKGLLKLTEGYIKDKSSCSLKLSPHQVFYDIHRNMAILETKAYIMMRFSWTVLKRCGRGSFSQELQLMKEKYENRTRRFSEEVKAILSISSREFYRCFPSSHIKGVTFEEVTRLIQGHIQVNADMNEYGSCSDSCSDLVTPTFYSCKDPTFCEKQKSCNGRLANCKYYGNEMQFCKSDEASPRRYEWIDFGSNLPAGHGKQCNPFSIKVSSSPGLLWHCKHCLCHCIEDEGSERYFSLREVKSNTYKNKVVIGVRLVKYEKVFHLQIREGILRERGHIEPEGWQPVKPINIQETAAGLDYHALTYENRSIGLTSSEATLNSIITGVRFYTVSNILYLGIRTTHFNFNTGQLDLETTSWRLDSYKKRKTELLLVNPHIPIESKYLPRDSTDDQFVVLRESHLGSDASQSTVPFFDIQSVNPAKADLITGIGLIHRGKVGSGGFIGLKLTTYDHTHHIEATPPP